MSTRSTFSRQLRELQAEVLVLGSMVDQSIARSMEVLKNRDMDEARRIIEGDAAINRKRFDIEELCLQTMATQQPMASDLRILASILYIITDLERMADYAEGTAKIAIRLGSEPPVKPLVDIPLMAEMGRQMLKESLDAFMKHDAKAAIEIANRDDEVDAIYDRVQQDLLQLMLQDPGVIQRATYLVWVAHNLERIADRVTNICERVAFVATGRMEEVNVSTY